MKKLFTPALVFVALTGFISFGVAQQARQPQVEQQAQGPQPQVPDAKPRHVHLTASPQQLATSVSADFPNGPVGPLEPSFGGLTINRHFRHTFQFPPNELCGQCVEGKNTLTLRYRALQGGPAFSSTSVNDGVALYSNGAMVPGTSQPLYSGKVITGQLGTKTIKLECKWLTDNRLSFAVQDDTSVTSATLDVDFSCASKPAQRARVTCYGITSDMSGSCKDYEYSLKIHPGCSCQDVN